MANVGYLHESPMAASLRCSLASLAQDRVASMVSSTSQSVAITETRLIGLETRTEALEHAQLGSRLEQLEIACRSAQQQLSRLRDERVAAEAALTKELESTRAEVTGSCKDLANKMRDQSQQLGDAHRDFASAQRRQSEELSKLPRLDGRLDAVNTRHVALDELVTGYHDEADKRVRKVAERMDKIEHALPLELKQRDSDTQRLAEKCESMIEGHTRQLAQVDVRIDQLEAALRATKEQVGENLEKAKFAQDALQKATDATRETSFRKIQELEKSLLAGQAELKKILHDQQLALQKQAKECNAAFAQVETKAREQGHLFESTLRKHTEELSRLLGLEGNLVTTDRRHSELDLRVVAHRDEATKRLDQLQEAMNKVKQELGLQHSQFISDTNRHFGVLDGALEVADRRMESVQVLSEKMPDIVAKQQQIHGELDEIIISAQQQLEMELSIARSQLDRQLTDLSGNLQQEMDVEVREARKVISEFIFDARERLASVPQAFAAQFEASRSGYSVGDITDASWNAGRSANGSPASVRHRLSSGARRRPSPTPTPPSLRTNARGHSQARDRSQPGMHIISATGWS